MNLDWQKDRKRYRSIYERQAEIRKRGLKNMYVNLNKQEIERDSGGYTRDRNRYWWIDEGQTEMKKMCLKEIDINLYCKRDIKKQRWIDKRQK